MDLRVVQGSEAVTHVALAGRLDIAGAQDVEDTLLDYIVSRKKPVLVDMSEVAFLTSSGIRMLIGAAKMAMSHGAEMVIISPQPLVAEILRSAGIDQIIRIADDENGATDLLLADK